MKAPIALYFCSADNAVLKIHPSKQQHHLTRTLIVST